MADSFDEGPWGICDYSGFAVRQSDMVTLWNGWRVARRFADVRNPQDFPYTRVEDITVRNARPEAPDHFITTPITPADL